MSLNDFSISKFKDAEYFEHVFLLKRSVSITVHEIKPMHDNVPLSPSNSSVRDSIDEPKRSKRPRVETSFGPNFLITFLIETVTLIFLSK